MVNGSGLQRKIGVIRPSGMLARVRLSESMGIGREFFVPHLPTFSTIRLTRPGEMTCLH